MVRNGGYIAIPHGKSEGVQKIGVSLAVLDHEIAWETLDDHGVRVIVLFAVGSDDASARNIGIAHTYIAQEKIEAAAQKAGDQVKIETQGTIGIENALTEEEIAKADIVLLAVDVKIAGEERFANKKVVKVPTQVAIKSPNKLIAKLHELVG